MLMTALTITWALSCLATAAAVQEEDPMTRFQNLAKAPWRQVLHDPGTDKWRDAWFLDGQKATVKNGPDGMQFNAGPTAGDDSCHAVLWTKKSFAGDIKVEYEYTRTDRRTRHVTILYIQATGLGDPEHPKDIARWSQLRTVPSMRLYYNHMNAYHISYAAFNNDNDDPNRDYIRGRRYMPASGKGLGGTALQGEYTDTGLFKTGVPYRITVIKKGRSLFMHVEGDGRRRLFNFDGGAFPPIAEGRIGLRHMYTRSARYRDFRVSVLKKMPSVKRP